MPRDLVVFGEDWGRHPSSTQHLMKHLARDRRILYVDSIGLRRPRIGRHDVVRAGRKLLEALGLRRTVPTAGEPAPANIAILAPIAIPWPGNPVAGRINRWLLGRRVRNVMARLDIQAPVLWITLPTALDVVGALGEHAVLYYCADDFSALAGVDHEPVGRMERALAARAQRVLAVSPPLAAKFPPDKTALLPHGADIGLFSAPAERAPDLPHGQVAGFYGSISAWLDQELLMATARLMPDWIFVLIGDVHVPVERLGAVPNIQLLGSRPHARLPGYAQHWDVALLPFLDTAQIRASNPLKLREYLATGRPVVATPFPALEPYGDFVRTATDAAGFAAAIREAAAEPVERRQARRGCVSSESWQARAAQAANWIDTL